MQMLRPYCSFLLFSLLALIIVSCRKDLPKCTGNCVEIQLSGRVFDRATNAPLAGQLVTANLYNQPRCLFCTTYKVGSANSGRDGRFTIRTSLDSTLFRDHHIGVSVHTPENYIQYPEPVGPGLSNERRYASEEFYELDPGRMRNIAFGFYPRVLLTIKLHRTTPLSADTHVGLDFIVNQSSSIWGLQERDNNADTSITIYTSANLFTHIITSKFVGPGTVAHTKDSVYCLPDRDNSVSVRY